MIFICHLSSEVGPVLSSSPTVTDTFLRDMCLDLTPTLYIASLPTWQLYLYVSRSVYILRVKLCHGIEFQLDGELMISFSSFSPGWGVWGGEGVKPPKKRSRVIKPAEPEKQRKDAGLKHVIISEERDKKAAKHQVTNQYLAQTQPPALVPGIKTECQQIINVFEFVVSGVWAYGKAGNGNEMETGTETGN